MLISISRDAVTNLTSDKNIIDSIIEAKRSLSPWVINNGNGSQRIIPVDLIKELD